MYAIVVGDGRVAERAITGLVRAGVQVGVVAAQHADDIAMSLPSALVIRGEGGDARALEAAGAGIADILIAACDDDAANMAACVEAKRVFGIERVVALSSRPDNAPAFDALGVEVVCSTALVASALLSRIGIESQVVA